MMGSSLPTLGKRVIDLARQEFPGSELGTALWLLRECPNDGERIGALIDADGDLTTLVLAVEDRAKLVGPAGAGRG
jgi:hypothetical protein